MLVYKEHKHAEYVVKAGEKAVQFARQSYAANTLEPEALALLLVSFFFQKLVNYYTIQRVINALWFFLVRNLHYIVYSTFTSR